MQSIDGLLIDLDGTVYQGSELIAGSAAAIDRLREAGVPFLFTTNTSRMSRSAIIASLGAMGLRVEGSEVFSAPVAAARWLRDEGVSRIHLLVADSTYEDFVEFEITDERPEALLVGDLGSGFTFERLNEGFRSLRTGARLVAIHRNRFWLTDDGPTLDAGPFVAALEYASRQTATLVGKPSPAFFDTAASLLGVDRQRLAVVGDDLETDIRGGIAAGLATVQVRTGKFDAASLEQVPPDQRPDHVVPTLADVPALLE
ncbi:MAG: HAD-IIA family hydrolase [Candidatus Palauibacterales bacterium]|jgi:HAD superfamily hydrolase (TIGR01458 family)|nr:HAD-IIA family hydrolase [Candidatus Palauibacterales bacterium]